MEKVVGTVTHYFPKVGVAVVRIGYELHTGDQVRISGPHQNFSQRVTSMQIEHQTITSASHMVVLRSETDERTKKGALKKGKVLKIYPPYSPNNVPAQAP
jgi:hypothetical protein